jgi:hypothetical protein
VQQDRQIIFAIIFSYGLHDNSPGPTSPKLPVLTNKKNSEGPKVQAGNPASGKRGFSASGISGSAVSQ